MKRKILLLILSVIMLASFAAFVACGSETREIWKLPEYTSSAISGTDTSVNPASPANHKHKYVEQVVEPATCQSHGISRYFCTTCGYYYEKETLPTDHKYVFSGFIWEEDGDGYKATAEYVCSTCKKVTQNYAATVTKKVTLEPTCDTYGEIVYTATYGKNTAKRKATLGKIGHEYEPHVHAPTCSAKGYTEYVCKTCDESYIDAGSYVDKIAHTWNTADEKTICEVGRTCTVCNEQEAARGHNYELTDSTDADCTNAATETYTCSHCGDSYTDVIGEPLGHTEGEQALVQVGDTCEYIYGYVCTECKQTITEGRPTAFIHNYTAKVTKEATCSTKGEKTYTCSKCNDSYTEEIAVDTVNGHDWDDGVKSGNVTTYTCKTCSETKKTVDASEVTAADVAKEDLAAAGEVQLKEAAIALDEATLGDLGDADVTLSADVYAKDDAVISEAIDKLDDSIKEQIGDSKIYNFQMKQNGENVSDFGGKVTITIPYELGENEDVDSIAIWYIDGEGNVTSIHAEYSNGCISFETDHFSYYAVTRLTPAQRCELYGHNWASNTVAATCTTEGYTHKVCIRCGATEKTDVVTAAGHDYTKVEEAATCTKNGKITYTCKNCGHSYTETVKAQGHNWEATKTVEPTCTENGYVIYTCSSCKEEIKTTVDQLGHDYEVVEGSATCTEDGEIAYVCKRCGHSYSIVIKAEGHKWEKTKTVEPTCTENGADIYTCKACGESYSEVIEATGHKYAKAKVVDPTCTENGYTEYRCSVCGDSYTADIVEAIGHKYACSFTFAADYLSATANFVCENDKTHTFSLEATVTSEEISIPGTEHGGIRYTATVKYEGKEYSDVAIVTKGEHEFSEVWEYDATSHWRSCYCGTKTDVAEHSFNVTRVPATCAEDGKVVYVCDKCGYTYEEKIPATGKHDYKLVSETPATCVDAGKKVYSCSVCGDRYEEIIPATGKHDYKLVSETEATCVDAGKKIYACSTCGDEYVVTVPATGKHTYVDGVCSVCGKAEPEVVTGCTHENYTEVTIDMGELGLCDNQLSVYLCSDCGKYFMTDMNAFEYAVMGNEGCAFEMKDGSQGVAENGNMYYLATAVCKNCGAEVELYEELLSSDGCYNNIYAVATFIVDEEDVLSIECYVSLESHYTQSTTYDLSDYGACEGNKVYYNGCACGKYSDMSWSGSDSCDIDFRSEEKIIDGVKHYYQSGVCSVCGLEYQYHSYSYEEGCASISHEDGSITIGDFTIGYSKTNTYYNHDMEVSVDLIDGEPVITVACTKCGLTGTYDQTKPHTCDNYSSASAYVLAPDADACEDGVYRINYCQSCGKVMAYDVTYDHVWRENGYELSKYGACEGGYLMLVECGLCGEVNRFDYKLGACEMKWTKDKDGTTEIGVCGNCGLTVTRRTDYEENGCEVTRNEISTLSIGEYSWNSARKTVTYEHDMTATVEVIDGATVITTRCSVCGLGETTVFEVPEALAEGTVTTEDHDGEYYCDVEFEPKEYARYTFKAKTNNKYYAFIRLYVVYPNGNIELWGKYTDGFETYLYPGERYLIRLSCRDLEGIGGDPSGTPAEITYSLTVEPTVEHNGHSGGTNTSTVYALPDGVTSCEDGVYGINYCTTCGKPLSYYISYYHIRRYDRYDLGDYEGSCGGSINVYSCICGEESSVDYDLWEHNITTTNSRYVDKDGNQHYVEARVCERCGLRVQTDTCTVKDEDNCKKVVKRRITANFGTELIVDVVTTSEEDDHDYVASYKLDAGATSCEDGVLVTYTCSRCNESYTERYYYHQIFVKEVIDLAELGSKCGGTATVYGCACGKENRVELDALCDFDDVWTEMWIEGYISGYDSLSENYYGYDSRMMTCAVTHDATGENPCAFKIRHAYYWLPGDGCTAQYHEIWQFGYNPETDTCLYEIAFATGERSSYHANVNYTTINETTDDGCRVEGYRYTCAACGSYREVIRYYNANDELIKSKESREFTVDTGSYRSYEHIYEYTWYVNENGYRDCYTARDYNRYLYWDGGESWEESLYERADYSASEPFDRAVRYTETRRGSYTSEYTRDYAYAYYKGYDFTLFNYYTYNAGTEDEYTEKWDYTYSFENGCMRHTVFTDRYGNVNEYDEECHPTWWGGLIVEPTCSQDGLEGNYCPVCGKMGYTYVVPAYGHDWVPYYDHYICSVCGIENLNGANGSVILEDLTKEEGENYVIGYCNREGVSFITYVELVLRNASEDEDPFVIINVEVSEIESPRAFIASKAAIRAAAEALDYEEADYDVRFVLVPEGGDGSFDYSITLTEKEPVQYEGYYLVGSMTDWDFDEEFRFDDLEEGKDIAQLLGVELAEGTALKVRNGDSWLGIRGDVYSDSDGNAVIKEDGVYNFYINAAGVAYIAKVETEPEECDVFFMDPDDFSILHMDTVFKGKKVAYFPYEKAGYTLVGWRTEEYEMFDFDTPVTTHLYLIAVLEKNLEVKKYTIKFIDDGRTVHYEEVEEGKYADYYTPDPKEGFSFYGWKEKEGIELYDFNTPVTRHITLYATWEEVEQPEVVWSVIGDMNGENWDVDHSMTYKDGKFVSDEAFNFVMGNTFKVRANGKWDECYPIEQNWLIENDWEVGPHYVAFDPESKWIELKAPAHEHDYVATVVDPTCTKEGYTIYTCSCGDSYVKDYTAALGHDYDEWMVVREATCTESGMKQRVCKNDESHVETEMIAALGHDFVDGVCTVCGAEDPEYSEPLPEGYFLVGSMTDWDFSDDYKFEYVADGGNKAQLLNVELVQGTAIKVRNGDRWFNVSGDVDRDADGNAVIKEDGLYNFYVNQREEAYVAKVHEHDYVATVVEPTCTKEGYTIYTCSCGDSYVDDKVPALGHDYVATVVEPTCTERGYTKYTCSVCGDSYVKDYTAALGHDYDEWMVVREATCTESGMKQRVCKNDESHVETEMIAALGHNFVDGVCTVCGAEDPEYSEPLPEGYFLVGSMTDWDFSDDYKFDNVADGGNKAQLLNVELAQGTAIKVRNGDDWISVEADESINVIENGNAVIKEDGVYNFYVNQREQVYIAKVETAPEEPEEPVQAEYYLIGSMTDWKISEAYKFATDETGEYDYILANVRLEKNAAIKAIGSTDLAIDDDDQWIGWDGGRFDDTIMTIDYSDNGNGIILVSGIFNVHLGKYLYLELVKADEPEEPEEPEEPVQAEYYLIGSMTDWKISEAYKFATDETGEYDYILANVRLEAGAAIKAIGSTDLTIDDDDQWIGWDGGIYDESVMTIDYNDNGNGVILVSGLYKVHLGKYLYIELVRAL